MIHEEITVILLIPFSAINQNQKLYIHALFQSLLEKNFGEVSSTYLHYVSMYFIDFDLYSVINQCDICLVKISPDVTLL